MVGSYHQWSIELKRCRSETRFWVDEVGNYKVTIDVLVYWKVLKRVQEVTRPFGLCDEG
uniref:Uncharacterized protein n=1 Tax=Candidatus Kentrum eta TaxID=2126337 RepID=A0A450UE72_9GAMM|nr:MAG: hypothetical protein BECKH772A_GA0070896_100245 [Candidatus Kentron sp. H]